MITKQSLLSQKKNIASIAKNGGLDYVALFGSLARQNNTQANDIDLLIRFKDNANYFHLLDLEYQFSDLLGAKVDLQTKQSISKYMYPYVKKDLIPLYQA